MPEHSGSGPRQTFPVSPSDTSSVAPLYSPAPDGKAIILRTNGRKVQSEPTRERKKRFAQITTDSVIGGSGAFLDAFMKFTKSIHCLNTFGMF